jgi:putative DNA-invertase from lambdoid prophage Rac
MSRTFLYARVSTTDQTTENQVIEVQAAGFQVDPKRIITETVSGAIPAQERPQFRRLLDRLDDGDVLIVTKMDRLGRNAMDVRATVELLAEMGVKVHCLAFGGIDLTSAAGKMTMGVISIVAEFERDLLVERTHAGLNRARAAGKKLGRKPALTDDQERHAVEQLATGMTIADVARHYGISRQVITRLKQRTEAAASAA